MAALVAALIVQASDRMLLASAALGTRHAGKGAVILALGLVLAVGNAAGAIGGWLIAPHLSSQVADLLVGLVLLSAGFGALWPPRARTGPARRGAFVATVLTTAVLMVGDRTVGVTAAIAARSTVPAFAAIGATIGALAINSAAVLLGEPGLRRLPMMAIRLCAAALLVLSGVIQALAALSLI